jgi:pimeloyl-ACP methyl ester carboxylesterase/DNA-binding CsgD family transcriptional regulator
MAATMNEAPPIQYVITSDGYNIAYSISGAGRPLVLMPESVSHIQTYWTLAGYTRDWLQALSARFQLVVYDDRGQGMSSRGLNADHSIEDDVCDLEAVIEKLGLERFILVSRSPAGVRYASRYPERVEALILESMPAAGSSWPVMWTLGLARDSWDLFLEMLAGMPTPDAVDRSESLKRLKSVVNQDDWLLRSRAMAQADVTSELRDLSVPTLVLHPREYHVIPMEESMKVAALVPNSRLVQIDGTTSRGDAAQGIKAIEDFLSELPGAEGEAVSGPRAPQSMQVVLSPRQNEVLRLLAEGKTTREIAEMLVVSERTIERHIADPYAKIGARNRAEATAFALNRLSV